MPPSTDPLERDLDLGALEEQAHDVLRKGTLAGISARLETLTAEDLRGRPWSRLVAAAAIADSDPTDPRAEAFLSSAWRSFARMRDDQALGCAAYIRGRLALRKGDIDDTVSWWSRAAAFGGPDVPFCALGLVEVGLGAYEDGHLRAARRFGEQSVDLARARGHGTGEAVALCFLGLLALRDGDFGACDELVDALRAIGPVSVGEGPRDGELNPLVAAAADAHESIAAIIDGYLAAVRGDTAGAASQFTEAGRLAGERGCEDYRAMATVFSQELLPIAEPDVALVEIRSAAEILAGTSDWWSRVAKRVEAMTLAAAGDLEAAEALIRTLTEPRDEGSGRHDGRELAVLGSILDRQGRTAEAIEVLGLAQDALAVKGSHYWAAKAAISLARIDTERAGLWRKRAHSLSNGDPAFGALFSELGAFRVVLTGEAAVQVDGEPATFPTRNAELAVYLLALAGAGGLATGDLCGMLWPEARPARWGPRLRTLLWQVRRTLGNERWRVERTADTVFLHTDGAMVDVAEAVAGAGRFLAGDRSAGAAHDAQAALSVLSRPLLPEWSAGPWLEAERERAASLAAAIATGLGL